jgi:hypothetical protein
MNLETDSTGVPIIPHVDGIGLLFSPPLNDDVFPCLPYRMARFSADFIAKTYPERLPDMIEYAKFVNSNYLRLALRRHVQRKLGHEAYDEWTRWHVDNLPRAERRRWQRPIPASEIFIDEIKP